MNMRGWSRPAAVVVATLLSVQVAARSVCETICLFEKAATTVASKATATCHSHQAADTTDTSLAAVDPGCEHPAVAESVLTHRTASKGSDGLATSPAVCPSPTVVLQRTADALDFLNSRPGGVCRPVVPLRI